MKVSVSSAGVTALTRKRCCVSMMALLQSRYLSLASLSGLWQEPVFKFSISPLEDCWDGEGHNAGKYLDDKD